MEMSTGVGPVIAAHGLTKRFGRLTAVAGLDLEVASGQVLGFLGPNGAGKTTTIRMLLGFLRPTAGHATILGAPAGDLAVRDRIGYLPGDLRVDPTMTGAQLFAWYGRLRGRRDQVRVDEFTERLGLDPSRPFGTLSKGNRQKVGIVQALCHDPKVIVLDEPTTGLDPLVQREFLTLLAEAAQNGAAILFSSHVLPEVERAATRVAIIRAGQLITVATVDDLLDQARRRLEIHFAAPVPDGVFTAVPGVVQAEIRGRTAIVTVDGPVGPALRAATDTGTVLRISPAGDDLEDLFVSLYRGGQPASEIRIGVGRP
jgi:ABC-2 type transport system ATP-binding protein